MLSSSDSTVAIYATSSTQELLPLFKLLLWMLLVIGTPKTTPVAAGRPSSGDTDRPAPPLVLAQNSNLEPVQTDLQGGEGYFGNVIGYRLLVPFLKM